MATDEIVSIHERLPMIILLISNLFGNRNLEVLSIWLIPAIPIVVALIIFFIKFLVWLPLATRRTFIIAATIYLGGCIGFEIVGAYCAAMYGLQDFRYYIAVTFEESFEMLGVIVFIQGLLKYIALNYNSPDII